MNRQRMLTLCLACGLEQSVINEQWNDANISVRLFMPKEEEIWALNFTKEHTYANFSFLIS